MITKLYVKMIIRLFYNYLTINILNPQIQEYRN